MMALSWKVFGSGLGGLPTTALCNDVDAGITATGTTQGTAYALKFADSEFTTVAAGTGAILYAGVAGDSQLIYNGGANPLTVYPDSGAKINGLPTNAGMLLPMNTTCLFKRVSATRWVGILSR